MKPSKESWIIHVFALLHAAVALVCRAFDIPDEILLTLLTMLMVVILCLRKEAGVMFMAVAVVLVNLLGWGLGTAFALGFNSLMPAWPLVVNPLSTLICTECIGWGTLVCINGYMRKEHPETASDVRGMRWLLIAFIAVLMIRMMFILLNPGMRDARNFTLGIVLDYCFSCVALVWVAEYAIRLKEAADKASRLADNAQYRYHKLKQQVNPHFLFNSLNVLDYLILEQAPEQASEYTHKLASLYRYLIHSEDLRVVSLREEMEFTMLYVDLMKVRFPEGLEVSVNIPEEDMTRSVVPCSVQLLIENAAKHNAVRPENPLRIEIHTTRNSIVVRNNICPKKSVSAESTGLGLKYLRQEYKELTGRYVIVRETSESYTVTIPML